ncbi:DUF5667 domain-containing protein [Nocardioides sp.]|uniref:DUF5667 domain-containing protein n=1 Tax=Nocardioides sp. TaxID=35761 RepID=UPI002ED4869D
MSPVLASRRRAEEFNTLVESSTGAMHSRYADAIELVEQLRALEPPAPRADFTAALREQLMEAADTLLLPAPDSARDTAADAAAAARLTLPPRRTARDRRIAAAVGVVAIVGASTSIAVAAQTALPGEMLYPVKRLLETAETGVHLSDGGKGAALLSNASDRLAEATALSRTSDLDESDRIASTLTTFSEQAVEASDLLLDDYAANGDRSSIETLNEFTVSSMATLTQLEAVLPPGARDELKQAAEVLVEIDSAASSACPACRGGIDQIPALLLSIAQLPDPTTTVPPGIDERLGDGRQSAIEKGDGTASDPQDSSDGTGPIKIPDLPSVDNGAEEEDPTGPIDGLLDGLTGQGDKNASNGGAGGKGGKDGKNPDGGGNLIDDTVGAVGDVLDLLDDPLAP